MWKSSWMEPNEDSVKTVNKNKAMARVKITINPLKNIQEEKSITQNERINSEISESRRI